MMLYSTLCPGHRLCAPRQWGSREYHAHREQSDVKLGGSIADFPVCWALCREAALPVQPRHSRLDCNNV